LAGPLSQRMRTSPPRRNALPPLPPLPPAAEPPDDDVFRGINPLDLEPPPRILEVPDGLMEMPGTQGLQLPDAGNPASADGAGEIRSGPSTALPLRHPRQGTPSSPGGFDRAKTPLLLHTVAQKGGQRRHKERALELIKKSVHQALQDPARRQALQAEGIAHERSR
jgi:hypothetical protein